MVGLLLVWPTPLLDARARNLLVLGHVVLAAVVQLLLSRLGAARTEPVAASVSDVARPARVEPSLRSETDTAPMPAPPIDAVASEPIDAQMLYRAIADGDRKSTRLNSSH